MLSLVLLHHLELKNFMYANNNIIRQVIQAIPVAFLLIIIIIIIHIYRTKWTTPAMLKPLVNTNQSDPRCCIWECGFPECGGLLRSKQVESTSDSAYPVHSHPPHIMMGITPLLPSYTMCRTGAEAQP